MPLPVVLWFVPVPRGAIDFDTVESIVAEAQAFAEPFHSPCSAVQ
jgi:hypothetical protein